MPKHKDTEFLYLSTLVRAKMEALMKTEQFDRMISAESDGEIQRILEEHGLQGVSVRDIVGLDRAINKRMGDILEELANRSPDPRIMDVFRIKYDYHNAKVLLKAQAAGVEGARLMSKGGRVAPEVFADRYYQGVTLDIPLALSKAMKEAKDILAKTGDAQGADIILDRAMYEEYFLLAKELEDEFLASYVRDMIDCTNLKTVVRATRMGLDYQGVLDLLIPGGNTLPARAAESANLESVYANTPFEPAAIAGFVALTEGDLTRFERLCDEALGVSLRRGRLIAFGVAPLIAYMAALENEAQSIRIVVSSKSAGVAPEAIRERLRDA